jgi:hypothetical protein
MAKRKPSEAKRKEDLVASIRKWASKAIDADSHNRAHISEAKRFLNGEHWHKTDKEARKNRPCLVIDRVNPAIDQAVGDQRQNMPSLKVRPTDPKAKVEWAQIKEGKIRHITSQLNAKMALNKASEHQFQGGIGYLRVVTKYAADDTFEQTVAVEPVYNELGVLWDPTAQAWDRMDGTRCMVYEKISKESYKEQYGKEPVSLEVEGDNSFIWRDEDAVIIAEYFVKEFTEKTLYALIDGTTTEDGDQLIENYELDKETGKPKDRKVNTYKIYRYKLDGAEIIEDKKEWPSKFWPVVPVNGKEITVDGKVYRRGITKTAMDPQRMYDYYASAATEGFALTSKAKTYVTPEMIAGHEKQWNDPSGVYPYKLVNAIDPSDPKSIAWPQDVPPPQASSAILAGLSQAADDIRTTTGRQLASLGAPSNETSGVAIQKRQTEGDVGDFAYTDNLDIAFCRVGEIILDLFPTIYDTRRTIRTLGEDGITTAEETINDPKNIAEAGDDPLSERGLANDMAEGKYEVIVDVGPSYTTQRQEAAALYGTIVQAMPQLLGTIGDIFLRNQDVPQSELVANRLKAEMMRGGKAYLLTEEEIQNLIKTFPMLAKKPDPLANNPVLAAKIKESQAKSLKLEMEALKIRLQAGQLKDEHIFEMLSRLNEIGQRVMMEQQTQPQQGQVQPGQPRGPQPPPQNMGWM